MRKTAEPFPWEAVMSFGLGVLKLSSKNFWALTPREIAAAMKAFDQEMSQPPSRQNFEELALKFPDE